MGLKNWFLGKTVTTQEIIPAPAADLVVQKKGWANDLSAFSIYMGSSGSVYAIRNLSPGEIILYYKSVAPLAGAIDRLAQAVGSLPIALIDTDTDEVKKKHPLLTLLRYPNADRQKTGRDFLRDMTLWKVLEGDVYMVISAMSETGQPKELQLLNPRAVSVQVSPQGYAQVYTYSTGTGTIRFTRNIRDQFFDDTGMRELYHIANFNPDCSHVQVEGDSEITQLYYEINQYVHASQHNLSLMQNGIRPCGAFVLKTAKGEPAMLGQEQFDRLQLQINEQYVGAANSGRPLVLEGGLEWQEMSFNPKDMDFPKMKEQAENQIYKRIGVPIQLISGDSVTANNMENIRREFYQNRVLPLGDDFMDHWNRSIKTRYRDIGGCDLQIDRDKIDVLIKERGERRKIIENSTTMTINEKRAYYNMEKIKYGDKIVDPNGRPIAGDDAPESEMVGAVPNTMVSGVKKPAAEPAPAEPPK